MLHWIDKKSVLLVNRKIITAGEAIPAGVISDGRARYFIANGMAKRVNIEVETHSPDETGEDLSVDVENVKPEKAKAKSKTKDKAGPVKAEPDTDNTDETTEEVESDE
jgi:hypothetical protein